MIESRMKKLWNKLFGWKEGEKVRASIRDERGELVYFVQGHIKQVVHMKGEIMIRIDVENGIHVFPEVLVEKGWIDHTPKRLSK